jgi:hypothetical protein
MFPSDSAIIYTLMTLNFMLNIFIGLLTLGAYHEINRLRDQRNHESRLPVASKLLKGERIRANFGIKMPPRAFILFLSYSCSGCFDICNRLQGADLGDWSLVIALADRPLTSEQLEEVVQSLPPGTSREQVTLARELPVPSYATVLHDPERRWFRELGVTATPTALALVGGRVVDQQVAPNITWFTQLPDERRARGKEALFSTT